MLYCPVSGRSFWLAWADYQEVTPPGQTQKTRPYDAFEMQKVDVLTAD